MPSPRSAPEPAPATPPDGGAAGGDVRESRDWRLLRRFVTTREEFHLAIAVTDDARERDALAADLAREVAADGVDLVRLDLRALPDDAVLLYAVTDALAAAPVVDGRRRALVVLGVERHLGFVHGGGRMDDGAFLADANLHRDLFVDRCPAPMVLWVSALAAPAIAKLAPDLWHWREGAFDLCRRTDGRAARLEAIVPRPDHDWQRQPKEDLERRRVLLEALLDEAPPADACEGVEAERRMRLAHELGRVLVQAGEVKGAEARFVEARTLAERLGDEGWAAVAWGDIADIREACGDYDEALRIRREEVLPVCERLGDQRERAVTMGQIADVLQARGDLDETLRIRREEVLPVYERLGEQRARAVTMGQIADVLQARGDLDEALRIRREEELPVFERLGDQRERVITMGRIADALQARGDLDAALRIRREEELPVFERLGDQRARAVTLGRIAGVLQARGDLDEALRILREEELPVYERLGDRRGITITMANIAITLMARDPVADREEAERFLCEAWRDAARMRLALTAEIRAAIDHYGFSCGADVGDAAAG